MCPFNPLIIRFGANLEVLSLPLGTKRIRGIKTAKEQRCFARIPDKRGTAGGCLLCVWQDGQGSLWYSRRESNPDRRFRKPLFYPLNYRGFSFVGTKLPPFSKIYNKRAVKFTALCIRFFKLWSCIACLHTAKIRRHSRTQKLIRRIRVFFGRNENSRLFMLFYAFPAESPTGTVFACVVLLKLILLLSICPGFIRGRICLGRPASSVRMASMPRAAPMVMSAMC